MRGLVMKKREKLSTEGGMRLSERALLANLHIGVWSASKTDRDVTEEVNTSHSATDAGKFHKLLISKKSTKAIAKVAADSRQLHRLLTLPWSNDGSRILKASSYNEYSKQMRILRKKFRAATRAFIEEYPSYKKEAAQFLGTMFNPDDYPETEDLERKFKFDVDIDPVPEKDDFRAKISNEESAALMKDLENRTNKRLKSAMAEIYARVSELTEKMFSKLEEYEPGISYQKKAKGIFRDSMIENLRELAELIPTLNVTDDPDLNELSERIKSDLCGHTPEQLRKSAADREKVARKAKSINKKAHAYLA